MDEEIRDEFHDLPATLSSDAIFGACAGATLCVLTALAIQAIMHWKVDALQVVFVATLVGGLIGCIAGFVQYRFRKTFDNSDLGVRLGVAFAILPSLLFLVSAFAIGKGGIFVVAIGFAGIMAGAIAAGFLDRLYEAVLKHQSNNDFG